MQIAADQLSHKEAYRLLAGAIVPRPIAWVTSVDTEGRVNAAPFSFFNGIGGSPPMVGISIENRELGTDVRKDTYENIKATGEYVINLVSADLAAAMHQTSAIYPPGVNELDDVGLDTVPSVLVNVPRIAASRIQFEC